MLYHHQIVLEGTQAYHDLRKENRLVLERSSSYEGTAYFKNPEVAGLADIMRQTTNILFSRMDGIWSGNIIEPPGMQEKYARANDLLVTIFEDSLASLERGARMDKDRIASVVSELEKQLDGLFMGIPQGAGTCS